MVAVLGRGVISPDTPVLCADDLGVIRGDGVFETLHVLDGQPRLLPEHLARMAHSAQRLDMPLPDAEALAGLARQACAAWPAEREGAQRLVCTRGRESGGPPTVFTTITAVGPGHLRARRDGITVRTATIAVEVDARPEAPWLLAGAKTLSYAANMASLRWGVASGADDVLWVSADGYALEGPTSSVIWLDDDVLCTVPPKRTGVLAGTTAAWLLGNAGELGWRCEERLVRPDELAGAAGLWLASSVRGLVEIRELDGVARKPAADTRRMQQLLGFPL